MQKADITSTNKKETIDGEFIKAHSKTGNKEIQKILFKDDFFVNNGKFKALEAHLGIKEDQITKLTRESRASRLSNSQKQKSKIEFSSENINKEILNFIDGRGSLGSKKVLAIKDAKEAENPFSTNFHINDVLKNPFTLVNENNEQTVESKYFSFKKNLMKKENLEKKDKENSDSIYADNNQNNLNIKNYNKNKLSSKITELESRMAKINISPIPKIARIDFQNFSHGKKISKNSNEENANMIKLINADLNLEDNPYDNFDLNEKNTLTPKSNNLLNDDKENSIVNELNKLNLNEEYFDKNNQTNKENINEFSIEEINNSGKKTIKKNFNEKIIEESKKDFNLIFNSKNNNEKILSKKGEKEVLQEEFLDSNHNKFHNQIISGMSIDKISTVFFNSNNNYKTNDFETMEIIKENFESLGYTKNFESSKNNEKKFNERKSNYSIKQENNFNNQEFNTEKKLFELKELNEEKMDTENKQITTQQSKLENSNPELQNLEEAENDQEIIKSYDSFHSEQLKISKLARQNRLSFASVKTFLQDTNRNPVLQQLFDSESEFRNVENNTIFNFTLEKRKSDFAQREKNQENKDLNLPLIANIQKIASIINKNNNNDNKKDFGILNPDSKNKNFNAANKRFRKMNTLENKYSTLTGEAIFKTIDEEKINSKTDLHKFNRNSFVENENASYYNAILDLNNYKFSSSSKNTLNNAKASFNSNSNATRNFDKDFAFDSEKYKKSKKRNSMEENSNSISAFKLNNLNYVNKNILKNTQKNKIFVDKIEFTNNKNFNDEFPKGEGKRKKIHKSSSLVEFPLKNELQSAYYNLNKKSSFNAKNNIIENSKAKLSGIIKNSSYNITNNKINNNSNKHLKNKTVKIASASSSKNNISNSNQTNNTNANITNNPSENSIKVTPKDEIKSASIYSRTVAMQSSSSIRKSEETKKQSFLTLHVKNNEETGTDLKLKDAAADEKVNFQGENNIGKSDYQNCNKINREEYNCNLNHFDKNNNNNDIFNNDFDFTTLNNEDFNTNNQNDCNLSQSEEYKSEVIQLANKAYDKRPKQMNFYNKNPNIISANNNNNKNIFNENKNTNNNYNYNNNNNKNQEGNSEIFETQNLRRESNITNPQNKNIFSINNNNSNDNINFQNKSNFNHNLIKNNVSSHKRTYSEALEHNSKKSEFGFSHNNNNKLLNSTNMLSNSKDLIETSGKINKIRELSLGKYMNVFTDVDNNNNDKSNVSYQSSRKNSRINDTQNQTDGDLSSYRFNKFSPHYSQVNKFNFHGCFNPDEILKNLNSNANNANNENVVNLKFNKNNNIENSIDHNNFVSQFSVINKGNTNNYDMNYENRNNAALSANNFKSKNYTPNSFRNNINSAYNCPSVANENKIKNIFS